MQIESAIEAVLFSVGDFVTVSELSRAIGASEEEIQTAANHLKQSYMDRNAGIQLIVCNDAYQLSSVSAYYDCIREVLMPRREQPLSHAALEVLSVVAYNQPVVKSRIEFVRGVDSSATLNRLVERGLVEECGRLDTPGKPILYRTTNEFLRTFGLQTLEELPSFSEFSGILPEEKEQEAQDADSYADNESQ